MLYEPIEPRLRFARLDQSTRWKSNRFHIIEPDTPWKNTLHARQLDIVLLPLVAFDAQGNRMIGVAHSCQQHPELPRQPWDVPLDAIITERDIIVTAKSR